MGSASFVNLHTAAKALAFLGGVSLMALTGACSSVQPSQGEQSSYVDRMRSQDYERRC
jgi:hypothetical protein